MNEDLTLRTLTLTALDEDGSSLRVTLCPMKVDMVVAKDAERSGQQVKRTQIVFSDGGMADIYISEVDLATLETAIGTYALPY